MKKMFALLGLSLFAISVYAYDPNTKVLRSFKSTFANAKDVRWEEFPDHYTVSFNYSGIISRVKYDLEGNITGSLRYYEANNLPLNLFTKLKKAHATKSFFGVTELSVGEDVVYFVRMQDEKNWYTYKVDVQGNEEVYEKFRKG